MTGAGRFAPSPTGDLHLGNLRTALLAWLFARTSGRGFLLRIEDLDRSRAGSADRQLHDLAAIGLEWDGPATYQSDHVARFHAAVAALRSRGLTYPCFCSRREIAESASAPHGIPGQYPGTCRDLTAQERVLRAAGRSPAERLRAEASEWTVQDIRFGTVTGPVDDLVLRRGDGVFAYNLAVVVDDAAQQIDQVVRGDDLLASSPRQAYLAHLLGLPEVRFAHVPLAVNSVGARLSKRDGAVTLADLAALGVRPAEVVARVARSLGLAEAGERITPATLLRRFDPAAVPTIPWTVEV